MNQSELQAVLAKFRRQGQKPTVAQLKAKLTTRYPLPDLINALKHLPEQSTDDFPDEIIVEDDPIKRLEQRISTLEAAQEQLLTRIETLEHQLK